MSFEEELKTQIFLLCGVEKAKPGADFIRWLNKRIIDKEKVKKIKDSAKASANRDPEGSFVIMIRELEELGL